MKLVLMRRRWFFFFVYLMQYNQFVFYVYYYNNQSLATLSKMFSRKNSYFLLYDDTIIIFFFFWFFVLRSSKIFLLFKYVNCLLLVYIHIFNYECVNKNKFFIGFCWCKSKHNKSFVLVEVSKFLDRMGINNEIWLGIL